MEGDEVSSIIESCSNKIWKSTLRKQPTNTGADVAHRTFNTACGTYIMMDELIEDAKDWTNEGEVKTGVNPNLKYKNICMR